MAKAQAHYPYQVPIDAYGNGGFRFAEMSHRGSILALPTGIFAWEARDAAMLFPDDLSAVLAEAGRIAHCLLGTGLTMCLPSEDVRKAFLDAGIALEPMATGSAARTYNILLSERRPVAAALIAIE